jgi:hypothetical protein
MLAMRTFAPKQKPSHQTKPANSKTHVTGFSERHDALQRLQFGVLATRGESDMAHREAEPLRRPAADVPRVLGTSGRPLDPQTQASMSARLGHDFGAVRVHADEAAAGSAAGLDAQAYTVGQHVVFGRDRYRPGTAEGESLLAHELNHTVEQRTGPPRIARLPNDPSEPEEVPATGAVPELELPEVRISHVAGATVMLVGGPADYDVDPLKFATEAAAAVPKIRAALPDTAVTILLVGYGFAKRNVYDRAKAALVETGANVVDVTTTAEVVSFLNTGLVSSDDTTPTRWLNITRFFYFGHGGADQLLLTWTWGGGSSQYLTVDDILGVKSAAFRPGGEAYLFTCNAARGDESFAVVWATHIGQKTIGAGAKTAYNFDWAQRHLEREIEGQLLPQWFLGMPYMNEVRIIQPPPMPERAPRPEDVPGAPMPPR